MTVSAASAHIPEVVESKLDPVDAAIKKIAAELGIYLPVRLAYPLVS
jgi:hypothetical protein